MKTQGTYWPERILNSALALAAVVLLAGCANPESAGDTVVDIKDIAGLAVPVAGETPVAAITENAQYSGTVAWTGALDGGKFAAHTVYTATITLAAQAGHTFAGVAANFFAVAGAETTNSAGSGVVLAVFPMTEGPTAFVAVSGISGVPDTATAGTPLALTGTAVPANATNRAILWTVKNAGTTGATITGNTLHTTAAGTVTLTATIAGGAAADADYTDDFDITVSEAGPSFVAVSGISGVPGTATAGTPLVLTGTAYPAEATNRAIVWTVKSAGTTGATITGDTLNTIAAGTVTLTATIARGAADGADYTDDFDLAVSPPIIAWSAEADGEQDAVTSTAIAFTFSGEPAGLTAADITITAGTGSVEKGTLTGGGTSWSLTVTVQTAGTVQVAIHRADIEDAEKTVTAHKAPEQQGPNLAAIAYKDTANKSSGNGSSIFDLGAWDGAGTAEESWTLNVQEKAEVYFAVTSEAGQTITAASELVAIHTDGTLVDGSTSGDTLAVITVDTGEANPEDLYFENHTFNFVLSVSQDGASIKTINVTLNRTVDESVPVTVYRRINGALVDQEAKIGPQEKPATGRKPVETLYDANRWLEANAVSGTEGNPVEYVLRLAADQETRAVIMCMTGRGYVSVELRGAVKKRTIYRDKSVSGTTDLFNYFSGTDGRFGLLTLHGYIAASPQYPVRRHLTLMLGRNIAIDGKGERLQPTGFGGVCTLVLMTGYSSTLVLEPGSEITGYDGTLHSTTPLFVPVHFCGDYSVRGEYALIINGGTVHDNAFGTYDADGAIDVRRYGSGVSFTFSHAEGLREEEVFFNNTGNRNLYFAGSRVAWD